MSLTCDFCGSPHPAVCTHTLETGKQGLHPYAAPPMPAGIQEIPFAHQRNVPPALRRDLLIKGGCVLTLDRELGDFEQADVLVRGTKILAIEPHIDTDAEILDASGMIVMPGFIDTHRHCWGNLFRRFAPNATLSTYGEGVNAISNMMRPSDVYLANLITCLGAIDAGITTLLDWSHISNTPEHSDAAIEALMACGIRGVYGYGQSRSGFPGSKYPHDIRRIKKEFFSSDDQMVTLFLAADVDRCQHWAFARELGVRITSHVFRRPEYLDEAGRLGLLGPDITYVHCTAVSETGWKMIRDTGGTFSLASSSIAQLGVGAGIPPIQLALDHGIRPSLSVDVEVSLPGDLFTQMRVTLAFQRALANERRLRGDANAPALLQARDVLEFATVEGARANGLMQKVGTLTPGKEADILVLRANDINTLPLNNAVGTVVSGADARNIEAVFIAGRLMKWKSQLLGVDTKKIQQAAIEARDYIAAGCQRRVDVLASGF
jgi:5-methylthioadenosine/S-adenosylhomocysteine deaminase